MCSSLGPVQPTCSNTSMMSFAICEVLYRIRGLEDSPMPTLSLTSHQERCLFVTHTSKKVTNSPTTNDE